MSTQQIIISLEHELARLRREVDELAKANRWLTQQLTGKNIQLFGPRSERLDAGQLSLYEEGVVGPLPEPAPEDVAKPRKKKGPGHGRKAFPSQLERRVVECDVPEDERTCTECCAALQGIGEDVCERGHFVPAKIIVFEYHKKKYACPNGHEVKTGQAPAPLVDRCKYEPSVFAHIAVAKFGDHLPLHRQQSIWKRHGIDLPRSTMWDMLKRVDEIAAQPILEQCRKELLEERVLQADETTVRVVTKGQKGTKTGYFWSWLAGAKQLIRFTTGRGAEGPKRMLGKWKGTLVTDGYSGYGGVAAQNSIVRAGCWAHARRKFKADFDTGSLEPREMLRLMQRLFRLEGACRTRAQRLEWSDEQASDLVRAVRERRSRALLDRIYKEASRLRQLRICTPKSKLGVALTYLENQRRSLEVFLDDPAVPLDNNACERALRHVVLGRRNWHLVGSARGAEVAASLYSLIGTCRAMKLDPEKYLAAVLVAVSNTPASRIAELTPWAWAQAHPEIRLS